VNFSELSLSPKLQEALKNAKFETMTAIQEESLPLLLEGNDILAKAPTGSGKTLAFSLALLEQIDTKTLEFQSLVLAPTRELAKQIADEIRKLAQCIPNFKIATLIGGESLRTQKASLDNGVHVVVATPGRVIDFMGKEAIDFSMVKLLVLDEADKMLEMGFFDDIKKVISQISSMRQSMLFSATFSEKVTQLAQQVLKHPEEVFLEDAEKPKIDGRFMHLKNSAMDTILKVLGQYNPDSTLIFCNTKEACKVMEKEMQALGLDALAIHGDLEQRDREEVLFKFENNSINILIATDVASRGLDINDLSLVINADLPSDRDLYQHRIGRTGRAGSKGNVVSLYKSPRALEKLFDDTDELKELKLAKSPAFTKQAQMQTLFMLVGKKDKIRKGDIVGALCRDAKLHGDELGMIKVEDKRSFVAVKKKKAADVLHFLKDGKIKGKKVKAKRI
jgi:ATP-dependent RNA helicase DbpA